VCQGVDWEVFSQRGGEGTFVCQSRGRYIVVRPLVRCLDESWALKADWEAKDGGSLAETGLVFEGAQAMRRAARRLLYLQ